MAKKKGPELTTLLSDGSIRLEETATDRDDAIRQVGAALHEAGAVDAAYADAMIDRENSVSTYVGRASRFRTPRCPATIRYPATRS